MKSYKIAIFSDAASWMSQDLMKLKTEIDSMGHEVVLYNYLPDFVSADFAFYLSFFKIVSSEFLSQFSHNLVVHASDLPAGRGWSPMTWQVLEGKDNIKVTLFEANSDVDSGDIYLQETLNFTGSELIDELRKKLVNATFSLCLNFIKEYPKILLYSKQQLGKATYYRRRKELDSELNPELSILSQFNLLRVVDNDRYPAYFFKDGHKYILKIFKEE